MTGQERTVDAIRLRLLSLTVVFFLGLCLHSPFAISQAQAAASSSAPSKAQQILDRWRNRKSLKNLKIGVAMQGLDRVHGAKVDANELYNPASGTKLLTTAAAMLTWNLDKRFTTRIYGRINNGRTDEHGLWIVGGGDPKLLSQDLERLADELKNKGLKHIDGPIHLDLSVFDQQNLPPAYEQKSTTSGYRAAIGAFGVDYGAITLSVRPAKRAQRPKVQIISAKGYAELNNRATQDGGKENKLTYALSPLDDGRMRVTIGGNIGKGHPSLTQRLRMIDPNLGAAHLLKEALRQRGIEAGRTIEVSSPLPPSLPLLIEHRGEPLSNLLKGVNTYSNNFMAETIFKHLGQTWERSQKRVGETLQTLGLKSGSFDIVNGSGLYRATTITPASMLGLLVTMAKHPKLGRAFEETLALSGHPGTLQRRLRRRLRGDVRAKTGTLNEVVSLSGYVTTKRSGVLAFAIFINESNEGRITKVRREIDRLIRQWSRL